MGSESIIVLFHKDIDSLKIDITPGMLCEDVIWQCVEHIKKVVCEPNSDASKNAAMYLQAFGLRLHIPEYTPGENPIWLPYWYKFIPNEESETRTYKFRVRHRPFGGFNPDSIVGEYLFLQMVDDFLQDAAFPVHNVTENRLLLLISIAFLLHKDLPLRNCEIIDKSVKTPQVDLQSFFSFTEAFSKPMREALKLTGVNIAKRYSTHVTLKITVRDLKSRRKNIRFFKDKFYEHLIKTFPEYCYEFYQVIPPDHTSAVSATLKLYFGNSENGLYYGKERECPMSDIEGMNIVKPQNVQSEVWTVLVHLREGASKNLPFKSEAEANSFLSMAQGMVKLCVRWDCLLCCSVLTPGEIMDENLKSFGPLFDYSAEECLHDLSKKPAFSGRGFLIHRSLSEYQVYIVLSCKQSQTERCGTEAEEDDNLQFERHRLILRPDGYMTLEKSEEDDEGQGFWKQKDLLSSLKNQFGLQAQPIDYARKADINEEYKKDIDPEAGDATHLSLLVKPWDFEREEQMPSLFLPKDLTNEERIGDKNIRVRKFKVRYKDREFMKVQVATSEEGDAEAFRKGLNRLEKLRRLKPHRFLQLHNFVLERRVTVVMELAPRGDLLTYICTEPQSPYDKVELMRQVVNVLQVMHECAQHHKFHGNIRARKFLVFNEPTTGHVRLKMEYPGVTSLLDTKPLDHELNLERLAWLSPERQEDLPKVTYESECYAVGTTLAEIVYRTDNFKEVVKLQDNLGLKLYLDNNHCLPPPESECGDDVEDLWQSIWETVIKPCWDLDVNLRPSPSILNRALTELSSTAHDISENVRRDKVMKLQYEDFGIEADPVPSLEQLQMMLFEKDKPRVTGENLRLLERLGDGYYGIVHKGVMTIPIDSTRQAETLVAVKMLKPNKEFSEKDLRQELDIAAGLQHENIVELLSAGHLDASNSQLVLIFEFMNSSTLEKYERTNDIAGVRELLQLCLDVVKGMVYLSGKDIVHRDLAPRNILLNRINKNKLVAKVSDFGLSRAMDETYRCYRHKTRRSCPCFVWPPECLVENPSDQRFSSRGDVWSFGILLWQVFSPQKLSDLVAEVTGENLRQANRTWLVLNLYKTDWRPPELASMPQNLYQVMTECWAMVEKERPPFVELSKKIEDVMMILPDK